MRLFSLFFLLMMMPSWAMLVATDDEALLQFVVSGPDGKPLKSANISLHATQSTYQTRGNTNAAGEVYLLAPEGETYEVIWNSAEGPRVLEQKVPIAKAPGAQEGTFQIQFREIPQEFVSPNSIQLDVRVTNFDARPISRAQIILKGRKSGREFQGRTDVSGNLRLRVEKGDLYDIQYLSVVGPYSVDEINLPAASRAVSGNLHVQYDDNTVELKNVYFETGKADLKPSSFKALDQLVYGMTEVEPSLLVEVAGHTDNVGGEEYNLQLSQSRAASVRSYLLKKGISPNRVTAVGYGFSQPVEDNATETGRARNRRTEVRILGGKTE